MAFYATFDSSSYYGSCPNRCLGKSNSPTASSPAKHALSFTRQECSCADTSFGGVFGLTNLDDDSTESYTKVVPDVESAWPSR